MHATNLIARKSVAAIACSLLLVSTASAAGPTPRSVADMEVGQMVEVEGQSLGGQMVLASEVEIVRFVTAGQFEGAIQAIDPDAKTLTVLGLKVVASDTTTIENSDSTPLEFSALSRGQVVEVKGEFAGDAGAERYVAATKLEVVDPVDIEIANHAGLEGQIQAIDADSNSMTVLGVTVKLTPTTEIEVE